MARLKGHHDEARDGIEKIKAIPEDRRTPKQVADLEFYEFKLGIPKLELQAKGIKTKRMAEYIEENLIQFYEKEGQLKVTNRERGRRSAAGMESRARAIANDKDVQAQGYCK